MVFTVRLNIPFKWLSPILFGVHQLIFNIKAVIVDSLYSFVPDIAERYWKSILIISPAAKLLPVAPEFFSSIIIITP